MGEEGRVYFRIYKACQDGIRIGIAANYVDDYTFYIKQYGGGEAPPFRLLTDQTHVNLNHYPEGTDIEYTDETASGYGGIHTVYFVKVFNVGWSEAFDSDYMDGIMIASPDYGYTEDDATGIVRSGEFDTCYTFNAPFDTLIAPFAQCVIPEPGGKLTAVFGYTYDDRSTAVIPNGANNFLSQVSGAPLKGMTPSWFEYGTHYNAFRFTAPSTGVTWQLEGASATATLASPRCKTGT